MVKGRGLATRRTQPFDVFDSVAAIYAFVHMQFGADGLREMLAIGDTDRETLMLDASVLHQMDLPSVAEIISPAGRHSAPPQLPG
jgi:hypothetical protein